jgi:hypothetical protein
MVRPDGLKPALPRRRRSGALHCSSIANVERSAQGSKEVPEIRLGGQKGGRKR